MARLPIQSLVLIYQASHQLMNLTILKTMILVIFMYFSLLETLAINFISHQVKILNMAFKFYANFTRPLLLAHILLSLFWVFEDYVKKSSHWDRFMLYGKKTSIDIYGRITLGHFTILHEALHYLGSFVGNYYMIVKIQRSQGK